MEHIGMQKPVLCEPKLYEKLFLSELWHNSLHTCLRYVDTVVLMDEEQVLIQMTNFLCLRNSEIRRAWKASRL